MSALSVVPSEDIPTCFWCGQEFRSGQALDWHQSRCGPPRAYECPVCANDDSYCPNPECHK
jgi:hypothetical protein